MNDCFAFKTKHITPISDVLAVFRESDGQSCQCPVLAVSDKWVVRHEPSSQRVLSFPLSSTACNSPLWDALKTPEREGACPLYPLHPKLTVSSLDFLNLHIPPAMRLFFSPCHRIYIRRFSVGRQHSVRLLCYICYIQNPQVWAYPPTLPCCSISCRVPV